MCAVKAVGFDLDGTLFLTYVNYDHLRVADRVVSERHNIPFSEIYCPKPEAYRLRRPIEKWLEEHGRGSEYPAISREIDDLSLEIEEEFLSEATTYPRSVECISILKSKGLKVGLLSRGGRHYAESVLKKFGIFEEMDAVVGRDHTCYDNAKPSPVAMTEFADELGVRPEEILYLGDNFTDYLSATGAGATFVGVLSGAVKADGWRSKDPAIRTVNYAGDVVDIIDDYL